jgi:hypothetical protein
MVVNRSISDLKIFQTEMDAPPHSRGALRPSFATFMSLHKEGAGNAGCLSQHPRPHVQIKKAHEPSHHRYNQITGIPCAMVLTVSFALSPVIGLCCHRRRHDAKASSPT